MFMAVSIERDVELSILNVTSISNIVGEERTMHPFCVLIERKHESMNIYDDVCAGMEHHFQLF